jgi:hypothetical protein
MENVHRDNNNKNDTVGVYILERECKTTTLDRVESGVSKRQFIESKISCPAVYRART